MKIGVLTFHRCINYGSYWQARCLVEGLAARGHDVVLLDHHDPAVQRAEWRCALQPRLPVASSAGDRALYAAKTRRFLAAFDRLPESPRFPLHNGAGAGEYDAIVVGSDEVWNLWHPWYAARPLFFGEGLRAGRRIAYAASFGNYRADGQLEPRWSDMLRRFDAISIRDENSRALIEGALDRTPAMVLDPCLQFPPAAPAVRGDQSPYLALYGHSFPDWFAPAIRRWAEQNGTRIVSIGYACEWADEARIDVAPEDFPSLIAGADAVATNFFHGCVFSLLLGRPFVCALSPYRFNKVRDLTSLLGAGRHLVDEGTGESAIADRLGTPLDPVIATRIAALRETSDAFLDAALG